MPICRLSNMANLLTIGILMAIICTISTAGGLAMIIKTRIFDKCDGKYGNLSEMARAMGLSVSQVYRVREGKRSINHKFIIGAKIAFPEYRMEELFYFESDGPYNDLSESVVTGRYMRIVKQFARMD